MEGFTMNRNLIMKSKLIIMSLIPISCVASDNLYNQHSPKNYPKTIMAQQAEYIRYQQAKLRKINEKKAAAKQQRPKNMNTIPINCATSDNLYNQHSAKNYPQTIKEQSALYERYQQGMLLQIKTNKAAEKRQSPIFVQQAEYIRYQEEKLRQINAKKATEKQHAKKEKLSYQPNIAINKQKKWYRW